MSRKGEAEPHDRHRTPRLAKPCRDAQGCVEIRRKLLPFILLPPASTRGVTWKPSIMSCVGSRGQRAGSGTAAGRAASSLVG